MNVVPRHAWVKPAVAGLVLLGEYLAISAVFDVQPVAARGGVWAAFAHAGDAALVSVLGMLAWVVLRPGPTAHARASVSVARPVRVGWLAVHGLCLTAFATLTWMMLGQTAAPSGPALIWLAAWVVAGAGSAWSLLAAVFELRQVVSPSSAGIGLLAGAVGLCAWQVGQLAEWLWNPMWHSTIATTAALLELISPGDVVRPGDSMLGLGHFLVSIDRTCSGFEGMGLAAVFTAVYWMGFRRDLRFPQALLLLPVSVALSWAGNVVRIVMLMLLGAWVDADLAVGAFHSKAGWVMFCAMALMVGWASRRLRFFTRHPEGPRDGGTNATAAFILPLLLLLATALVTGLFARTFDAFYGARLVAAGVALFAYRHAYPSLWRGWTWRGVMAGTAVAAVWIALPGPVGSGLSLSALAADAGVGWIAVRVLGSATIVPVCEELAFRGFLLRRLVAEDFTTVALRRAMPWAIVASSLVFGLLHERWLVATVAGIVFAVVQTRTGRLSEAVAAHAVSNGLIALWVLVSGDLAHWAL